MNAISENDFSAGAEKPDCSIGWGERIALTGFLLFFISILAFSLMVNPFFCLAGFVVLTGMLLSNEMSRAHGYIVLGGLGIIVLCGVCEVYGFYKPLAGAANAFCLVSVRFLPTKLVATIGTFGILLVPFVALEAIYWMVRAKCWKWIAALLVIAAAAEIYGVLYVGNCKQRFDSVYALTGRTLSEDTFVETYGDPAYRSFVRTNDRAIPQWRYSDGRRELSVTVNGDGTVTVNDRAYPFLDL